MVNITFLVHNRCLLTKQAIDSLMLSRIGDEPVLILDDRSDDGMRSFLKMYGNGRYSLTCNDKDMGTGGARNAVIADSERRFGRGDYLYLSDNDVYFKPGWLETLIDCYEAAWSSGCRVLGGIGHPYHQRGVTLGVCSFNTMYAVHEVLAQPLQSMLMRWDVFDEFGPFKETSPGAVCQGEDVEFGNAIRAAGYKLGVVDPPLLVNTGITNSFGEKIPGWELVKAQCPEGVICE